MPEGVLEGGQVIDVGVDQKGQRPPPPPDDPHVAPKGWRWARDQEAWVPRKRAPRTLGTVGGGPGEAEDDGKKSPPEDSAWATGPDGRERHELPEGPVDLTPEQRDEVVAMLELFALPFYGLPARDPYCGQALVDAWPEIRERSLPLIARSPALVEWLTKAGGFRDWLMFANAIRPVATAVVRHHVVRTVVLDEEGKAAESPDLESYAA